jgi:ribosomal protein S18 acetylase RimI-like enzyme
VKTRRNPTYNLPQGEGQARFESKEVTPGETVELRRATGKDAMGVARVHIATWRSAYHGIVPQEFLDSLSVSRRARSYTFDVPEPGDHLTWIALDRETVVGFVTVGQTQVGDVPPVGEVQALYVASDRWRSGIGSTLLDKGEELLIQRGHTTAVLWVLEDNSRGRSFYEAQGWSDTGEQQLVELGGSSLVEVRYRKALTQR